MARRKEIPKSKPSSAAPSERDEAVELVTQDVNAEFVDGETLVDDDNRLIQRLEDYNSTSPELSAGDVDAQWERADIGEETVGGSAPTPDQDVVDELGDAVGVHYEDGEPLHTEDKLADRDRERWELDPRSRRDDPAQDDENASDET